MTRHEKAARIAGILRGLYPNPNVPLDHVNAFRLLVAVLLSAQCTDATVNTVTPALFALADTPAKMARLGAARILELVRPCGLAPTKSKHIHALSEILVERHGGCVPDSFEALEALPGIGHKSASVVIAQAFGRPAFPVDTHIHRLAWRWGLSDGRHVERTEADLKRVFPEKDWRDLHLQIIYYGREYCPALRHELERCRICREYGVRSRLGRSPART
jgi:endonuclease-3